MTLDPVAIALVVGAALDELGIRYALGGALASTLLGEPRSTQDVDVLVDVNAANVASVIRTLEARGFYVPAGLAAAAVATRGTFNVVHIESAIKADLFVAGRTPLDVTELARAVRIVLPGAAGASLSVAAAEDLVAQKLKWFRDGGERSDRQWRDVLGLLKVQGPRLDRRRLAEAATILAVSDLLARAVTESGTDERRSEG